MSVEGERRAEILDTAASLFGSSGIRTSLQQLADACGMLPGSLYHHFESKDAIYIELVERYRADLDRIAEVAVADERWIARPPLERVVALGEAISECAIRHRAALLLTFYEPPTGSSVQLVRLARGSTAAIRASMTATLSDAKARGHLRPELDLALLSDRICQSMLQSGIGEYHRSRGARRAPGNKCRILLHGVAARPFDDKDLDGSAAVRAADEAIQTWDNDTGNETVMRIKEAARQEFARRGYDVTTVRDIATEAGLSAGGVYRHFESKDALYWSLMQSYIDRIADGWKRVVSAPATPFERLDALLWLAANVIDRFAPEHRIQAIGQRYSPPTSAHLIWSAQQIRELKRLLVDGEQLGELRSEAPSTELWSRSVYALVWMPESLVQNIGVRASLRFGRETVLRGAAPRG